MIKITDTQDINELLRSLEEKQPFLEENKFFTITGMENLDYDPKFDNPFLPLNGYQVKITTDGKHKTDGQMVEYTFKFKNPEGVETDIVTEMCLVIGFNRWDEIEIA